MSSEHKNIVELVMTVPESYGASFAYQTRCRTTMGVLVQLLCQSQNRVIIGAPFIQPSYGIVDGILAAALKAAVHRGVNIKVLSTGLSLQVIEQDHLLKEVSEKLELYRPSDNLINEQKLGSHAKFCVMDGESAYIGSANLTSPGLSSQLELGVLVHGEIALQIEQFWDYAVDLGLFIRIT